MFGVSEEILFLEVRNEVQDFGLSENETVHKKRNREECVFWKKNKMGIVKLKSLGFNIAVDFVELSAEKLIPSTAFSKTIMLFGM